MSFIETLQWRYATKAMNKQKVAPEKMDMILEAARLAPTSSGLQPFEIFVVTNDEIKEKIKSAAHGQSVVSDCSHLLVFAAWDNYTEERINKMFDLHNETRGFTNEGWEAYRKHLLNTYPKKDAEINFNHAAKQAYISFGIALAAAAMENVDATPMEGFDPNAVDEILGLKQKGLRSCVMMAVGYRDAEKDWNANLKKVRRAKQEFVTEVN